MTVVMESGLKTLSRISSFKNENVLIRIFHAGKNVNIPKAGESLVEFAFTVNASETRHRILFDIVLAQIAPKSVGGLEGETVFIDTESTFSVLDFAVFIEKYLTSLDLNSSQTAIIDQVSRTNVLPILNRLHIIPARTTTECVIALWGLRDFLKGVRASLIIVDSLSTCFGLVPKKEFGITQSLFFDLLRQTTNQFSLYCIVCRVLRDPESDGKAPFAYQPTHRVQFSPIHHQKEKIPIKLFECKTTLSVDAFYTKFSKSF